MLRQALELLVDRYGLERVVRELLLLVPPERLLQLQTKSEIDRLVRLFSGEEYEGCSANWEESEEP